MDKVFWDIEDFDEEVGSDGGAKDDAFGPIGVEGGVVVGVEVGEEVGNGEVCGVLEAIDDEAGVGDEFWEREGGGGRGGRLREGEGGRMVVVGVERRRVELTGGEWWSLSGGGHGGGDGGGEWVSIYI